MNVIGRHRSNRVARPVASACKPHIIAVRSNSPVVGGPDDHHRSGHGDIGAGTPISIGATMQPLSGAEKPAGSVTSLMFAWSDLSFCLSRTHGPPVR